MEMGELIIHIDQDSGAVTKVVQTFKDKEAIMQNFDCGQYEEENEILLKISNVLKELDPERYKRNKLVYEEIKEWLKSNDELLSLKLPPLGDIYNDHPAIVRLLKAWRDRFDRIIPVPVELWEIADNTVCTVRVGGTIRRCIHRR
jgi:hypothetical protein